MPCVNEAVSYAIRTHPSSKRPLRRIVSCMHALPRRSMTL
jgi:hypothetical protein